MARRSRDRRRRLPRWKTLTSAHLETSTCPMLPSMPLTRRRSAAWMILDWWCQGSSWSRTGRCWPAGSPTRMTGAYVCGCQGIVRDMADRPGPSDQPATRPTARAVRHQPAGRRPPAGRGHLEHLPADRRRLPRTGQEPWQGDHEPSHRNDSAKVPTALVEISNSAAPWRAGPSDVIAFFEWPGTSNGPTEAINGRLEHLRGSALGFPQPTNYIGPQPARRRRIRTLDEPRRWCSPGKRSQPSRGRVALVLSISLLMRPSTGRVCLTGKWRSVGQIYQRATPSTRFRKSSAEARAVRLASRYRPAPRASESRHSASTDRRSSARAVS